jgi:hypothetical protein
MGEHKGTTNYDPDIHHRRSIRVKGYDYSSDGAYFVTICAQNVGADLCVCPDPIELGEHTGSPLRRIVQWFKTMSTNEYIRNVKINHWPRFDGKLWQRNYYEHIIRNDDELNRTRKYIINNPINWHNDENNPVTLARPDYFKKINEEIL